MNLDIYGTLSVIQKEVNIRIGSTAAAIKALNKVWKSTVYKTRTKVNNY